MPGRQKKTATPAGRVRIIAGKWRGRRLDFPSLDGLRPTGDRVRETLFNWLQPELPGALCLDLFAGSGALGFEAVSRGARRVTLIEKDPSAVKGLLRTRDQLGINSREVEIIHQDALAWLQKDPGDATRFDIVFVDPPFNSPLAESALIALARHDWLSPGALVYIESSVTSKHPAGTSPRWQLHRHHTFGAVLCSLYRYA